MFEGVLPSSLARRTACARNTCSSISGAVGDTSRVRLSESGPPMVAPSIQPRTNSCSSPAPGGGEPQRARRYPTHDHRAQLGPIARFGTDCQPVPIAVRLQEYLTSCGDKCLGQNQGVTAQDDQPPVRSSGAAQYLHRHTVPTAGLRGHDEAGPTSTAGPAFDNPELPDALQEPTEFFSLLAGDLNDKPAATFKWNAHHIPTSLFGDLHRAITRPRLHGRHIGPLSSITIHLRARNSAELTNTRRGSLSRNEIQRVPRSPIRSRSRATTGEPSRILATRPHSDLLGNPRRSRSWLRPSVDRWQCRHIHAELQRQAESPALTAARKGCPGRRCSTAGHRGRFEFCDAVAQDR